jgi:hypothetical protein
MTRLIFFSLLCVFVGVKIFTPYLSKTMTCEVDVDGQEVCVSEHTKCVNRAPGKIYKKLLCNSSDNSLYYSFDNLFNYGVCDLRCRRIVRAYQGDIIPGIIFLILVTSIIMAVIIILLLVKLCIDLIRYLNTLSF